MGNSANIPDKIVHNLQRVFSEASAITRDVCVVQKLITVAILKRLLRQWRIVELTKHYHIKR